MASIFNKKSILVVVVVLVVISCMQLFYACKTTAMSALSPDPNFHIYLCFGQSNMEGSAPIESEDVVPDDRFLLLQAMDCPNLDREQGEWYPAVPPLSHCDVGLSPADAFGKHMLGALPSTVRIGVINIAVGGCDIRLFDKDQYQNYTRTWEQDWFMDKIKAYNDNPYLRLITLARKAQQEGVIKGILLHQGETNTGDEQWPYYVEKIYSDLLTDLNLNASQVPLLAGETVHKEQGGVCARMNPIINRLPELIPTAYVISSQGCAALPDSLHFSSAGCRELGQRYAAQILTIQEQQSKD